MSSAPVAARRLARSRAEALVGSFSVLLLATLFAGLFPWGLAGPVAALTFTVFMFWTITGIPLFDLRRVAGALSVERDSLLWDGKPLLAQADLVDAIAYENGKRCGVRIRSRWRTTWFEVDALADADRLVEALGKDSDHAAIQLAGRTAGVGALSGLAVWMVSVTAPLAARCAFAVVVTVLPYVVGQLLNARWLIGNDGLRVRRGLGPSRFIPHADVREVRVDGGRLWLHLRDGSVRQLRSAVDSVVRPRPVVGARSVARRNEQA